MAHWFAFVGAAGLAVATSAEPTKETLPSLPFFGHIVNAKENSALSMDCDGDPLGTIDCHFTQVTVSVDKPEDVAKARSELAQAPAAERKDLRRSLCSPNRPAPPAQIPQRAALTERYLDALDKACACPDEGCFDQKIVDTLIAQQARCRVWTHNFRATLKRVVGQRKWVGVAESGLCRDVNGTVVERDEKGWGWTFTQTRLTTDTTSDLCKDRKVNEPVVYATDVEGSAILNCEVVDFGH